ncbi:MAG: 30S ribosomal protein S3 [Proteobacteria bacterium]|nr:30S ribosomal protein S3 [Pseudomonadota bacterium]
MGQKVNPIGLRLGIINTWSSSWYANRGYADKLQQDLKVRKYVVKTLKHAGLSELLIERTGNKLKLTIKAARPGVIISKKGEGIEKVKKEVEAMTGTEVSINIIEEKKPELSAVLVADGIAQQLERRVAFRKAMKRAIQSSMRMGAQGIKVSVSGRLGGAEIARTEWYREGRVPLHTLRADVQYATAEAMTTYGVIGVKVWIYKGHKVVVEE